MDKKKLVVHYSHCKHCKFCEMTHPYPCEDTTCTDGKKKLPTKVVKSV